VLAAVCEIGYLMVVLIIWLCLYNLGYNSLCWLWWQFYCFDDFDDFDSVLLCSFSNYEVKL